MGLLSVHRISYLQIPLGDFRHMQLFMDRKRRGEFLNRKQWYCSGLCPSLVANTASFSLTWFSGWYALVKRLNLDCE